MQRLQLAAPRAAAVWLILAAILFLGSARPVCAVVSAADEGTLAGMALQWALAGGIPDVKLLKDPSTLMVADFNLRRGIQLTVPGHNIALASLPHIQAHADLKGDMLYFRFDRFTGDASHATVAIALVWAVSANSTAHYLSGGGATLEFEKVNGAWQLKPVKQRWVS